MKLTILVLLLSLSGKVLSRSGDGLGNGGLGYSCLFFSNYSNQSYDGSFSDQGRPVGIVLDIVEEFQLIYQTQNNINLNFDYAKTFIKLINEKKEIQIKEHVSRLVSFEDEKVRKLFSFQDLEIFEKVKASFMREYQIELRKYPLVSYPLNITKDEGSLTKLDFEMLKDYGLHNCYLAQIAILHKKDKKLILFETIFKNLNKENIQALFYHEIIYLALKDKNSLQTRKHVSKIMRALK